MQISHEKYLLILTLTVTKEESGGCPLSVAFTRNSKLFLSVCEGRGFFNTKFPVLLSIITNSEIL